MIGIKNNNGFFRISVAVIMLLSTLGLIRLSAQSHDTVDSYSETFYAFYGFFPYEFYFSDNRARRLTVNFYGKNRLVIENNSYVLGIKIVRDKDRGLFPFRDTIYFHVIDPPQKELSVRHRQIIVDSVTSTRHITASQTVPPYRDIKFEDTNMVFPLLQKSDTIFVSRNNRHLRIRDFEFSVYQYKYFAICRVDTFWIAEPRNLVVAIVVVLSVALKPHTITICAIPLYRVNLQSFWLSVEQYEVMR